MPVISRPASFLRIPPRSRTVGGSTLADLLSSCLESPMNRSSLLRSRIASLAITGLAAGLHPLDAHAGKKDHRDCKGHAS